MVSHELESQTCSKQREKITFEDEVLGMTLFWINKVRGYFGLQDFKKQLLSYGKSEGTGVGLNVK